MPTILITGAATNLGRALSDHYAAEGWTLILADKDTETITRTGATALCHDPLDDTTADAIARDLAGCPIDVMLLHSEISEEAERPVEEITQDSFERVFLSNTWASLRLAALLEPNVMAGGRRILAAVCPPAAETGSYTGKRRYADRASRAALLQMLRNLEAEWKDRITVLPLKLDPRAADAALRVTGEIDGAAGVFP